MCKTNEMHNSPSKGLMVCNATFNNISVISCLSVLFVGNFVITLINLYLFVDETGVPGENH